MEECQSAQLKYLWDYLGSNQISDEGCNYISKVEWKNLNQLYLCRSKDNLDNNKFGDKGCKYLSEANWKNINHLNLSYINAI